MTHEDEPKCMVCGGTGTVSGDSGPPKARGDYQVFLSAYCPNCDVGRALLNAPPPVDALAAMQARAEKAEHALEITGDAKALARFRETERERDALLEASRLSPTGMETVRAAVRLAHDPDARILLKANIEAAKRAEAAESKLAALEARLAEVAPVVEAAEAFIDALLDKYEQIEMGAEETRLFTAVRALRAARSLRGAGEGGGA